MDIRETKTKMLKVADLRPNTGQIEGVPSNPRSITRAEFDALCESMKADDLTGVLQVKVYKHAGEWVVLDGNMRLKAMQTIGVEEVQCVIVPEGTNAATLRKIVINSNSTFGEWDMDMLANEWDPEDLKNWGVDVPPVPEESSSEGDADTHTHTHTHNASSVIIASVTLFGQTDETIVIEQLTDEQAEKLLALVKSEGAHALVEKMMQ